MESTDGGDGGSLLYPRVAGECSMKTSGFLYACSACDRNACSNIWERKLFDQLNVV